MGSSVKNCRVQQLPHCARSPSEPKLRRQHLFQSSIVRNTGYTIGDTIDRRDTKVTDIYSLHELAQPSYSDQVLPFDITLAGANEYGAMCAAKILGVEILNEGSGISVDDAVSEALAGRLRPGLSV